MIQITKKRKNKKYYGKVRSFGKKTGRSSWTRTSPLNSRRSTNSTNGPREQGNDNIAPVFTEGKNRLVAFVAFFSLCVKPVILNSTMYLSGCGVCWKPFEDTHHRTPLPCHSLSCFPCRSRMPLVGLRSAKQAHGTPNNCVLAFVSHVYTSKRSNEFSGHAVCQLLPGFRVGTRLINRIDRVKFHW